MLSLPRVRILIAPAQDAFNKAAAEALCHSVRIHIDNGIQHPNITPARGNTQVGIYSYIAEQPEMCRLLSNIRLSQLDEIGFNKQTLNNYEKRGIKPKYFRDFTQQEIILPWQLPQDRVAFFDTNTSPEKAVAIQSKVMEKQGPLHIAFLGIGAKDDDHFAQVSAGTLFQTAAFSPPLTEGMKASYRNYVGIPADDKSLDPDYGLSLGPANMPKTIIVAANGANKAEPVYNMLCHPLDPQIPTTILREDRDLTVILDQEAASVILEHENELPEGIEISRLAMNEHT